MGAWVCGRCLNAAQGDDASRLDAGLVRVRCPRFRVRASEEHDHATIVFVLISAGLALVLLGERIRLRFDVLGKHGGAPYERGILIIGKIL